MPLSWVYGAVAALRRQPRKPYRGNVPVICVGNLTVGGTGKTPTVCALVELLKPKVVHIVTRGYKSQIKRGVHRVNPNTDNALVVGDEPLLLAWRAPCWIAPDRAEGIRHAQAAGAQVIIMDDGFQNPSVAKDFSLVVVDTDVHYGNNKLLPAGPLREPVDTALPRADAIVAIGTKPYTGPAPCPVWHAYIRPKQTGLDLRGARVVAFAGIGRPQKFFQTLQDMGAQILDKYSFPDHATYDTKILSRIVNRAQSQDALVVTTEKDAVKLPKAFLGKISTVQIELVFKDSIAFNGTVLCV